MDATPLLGTPTGVATFCSGALAGLAPRPELALSAFAVSWRSRGGLGERLPPGVARVDRPMPARPLHRAWRSVDLPPIEWLTGPLDVVHGSNFVVPPSRRAARVATVHDLTALRFPEMCEPASRGFPALVRRAAERGAWIHTPSAWVAEEVVEMLGADPSRVRAIHHGAPVVAGAGDSGTDGSDPGQPPPGGRPSWLPEGTSRYVLALGTVEPRKDLPALVRSFDRLAGARPDLALVLAGPDGWGTPALAEALEASPFARRIVRTGWVDPPARDRLLRGAEVFAYPSVYEGFGFPPLEAMAAGVPVVATMAGALPEVLGDGADLVPVGDVDSLAGAIERVIDDRGVSGDLVARGGRRLALYRWDRCAAELVGLYRDALAAERSRRP